MFDINKLANVEILASYEDLFNDELTINEHLKHGVDIHDLCLLSAMSFYEGEDNILNEWVSENFKELPVNKVIFGRLGRLSAWKYLLSNLSELKVISDEERYIKIIKLFLLINDMDNGGDYSFKHQFSLGFIINYRDRYIAQYYRAQKTFLSNSFERDYLSDFHSIYGVKVNEYFHVIHSVVKYYKNSKKRVDYNKSFNPIDWQLNIITIANEYNCDINIYKKVMNCISFDLNEGKLFSLHGLGDVNNNSLFRDKPFIEISTNIYIPIDGKLVEDLLFNNLFYKIKNATGEKFLSDFGVHFENYIKLITEFSISTSKWHRYRLIPEFKYKKGQCKSPDLILLTDRENCILVVEVKSARVLAKVTDSNNDEAALNDSLTKLKLNPWGQSAKAISEIIDLNVNSDVNNNKTYYFLAVTMNDIPMSLIKFDIINENGSDISEFFFSMNVEAYECLLEIISSNSMYSVFDILRGYRIHESSMSIKTYLARLKKVTESKFNPLIYEMNDSQVDSIKFLNSLARTR